MITDFVILSVLIVLLIASGLWLLQRQIRGKIKLPYQRRDTLNTPMEQAFYRAVSRALGDDYYLACKVRVADLLEVAFRQRHARDQRWWRHFRLISSKHVDLVVCEPAGGRILLAIELDDRSHRRGDRKRRDRFIDRAFSSAKLPLLRFPAQGRFDGDDIRQQLAPYLVSSETEGSD